MAEKSSPGTRQTDGKNLVWFGEIDRNLAKLSILPLLTVLPLNYFMCRRHLENAYLPSFFRSLSSLCIVCLQLRLCLYQKAQLEVEAVPTTEKDTSCLIILVLCFRQITIYARMYIICLKYTQKICLFLRLYNSFYILIASLCDGSSKYLLFLYYKILSTVHACT